MSIGKDIGKCKKINERSLDKVSLSSYTSKNEVFLGWSIFEFLVVSVGEIVAILAKSEAFELKYSGFLY